MQKLPIVTLRRDIEVKSVNGQLVFDLYKQILRILALESPEGRFVDLFAEPILNNAKGEITWYTRLPGEVRSLGQLSVSERQSISRELSDASRTLEKVSSKLVSASGGRSFGADAFKSIFVVPDLETSLFSVNGHAVLTQWGCIPFGTDPQNFDVIVQDKASLWSKTLEETAEQDGDTDLDEALTPAATNAATVLAASGPSAEPASFPQDESIPPTLPAFVDRGWPWAWLLATFLLLLLLLAGTLFHLKLPFLSSAEQTASIRSDIAILWQQMEDKADSCVASTEPGSDGPVTSKDVSDRLNERAVVEGVVNVALAWQLPVDLDLAVTDPSGDVISYLKKVSTSGGRLDIDANAPRHRNSVECDLVARPVENISWSGAITTGTYRVDVKLFTICGAIDVPAKIPFTVVVTNNGNVQEIHKEIQCSHNACDLNNVHITDFTVN